MLERVNDNLLGRCIGKLKKQENWGQLDKLLWFLKIKVTLMKRFFHRQKEQFYHKLSKLHDKNYSSIWEEIIAIIDYN